MGTESPDTYSDRAKYLFHADGKSLWFDKSLTVVVTEDGRFGFHCEHSLADAPVYGHILEYNVTTELVQMNSSAGYLMIFEDNLRDNFAYFFTKTYVVCADMNHLTLCYTSAGGWQAWYTLSHVMRKPAF